MDWINVPLGRERCGESCQVVTILRVLWKVNSFLKSVRLSAEKNLTALKSEERIYACLSWLNIASNCERLLQCTMYSLLLPEDGRLCHLITAWDGGALFTYIRIYFNACLDHKFQRFSSHPTPYFLKADDCEDRVIVHTCACVRACVRGQTREKKRRERSWWNRINVWSPWHEGRKTASSGGCFSSTWMSPKAMKYACSSELSNFSTWVGPSDRLT